MSPKELGRIGRRLYGHDWQSPLGRRLKKHRITVWRWFNGDIPIPNEIAEKLRALSEKEREKVANQLTRAPNDDVTEEMLEAGYAALLDEPHFRGGSEVGLKKALTLAFRAMMRVQLDKPKAG